MDFEIEKSMDYIQEGVKETAELLHKKTRDFHENYVSKITPKCGKYGDVAKFAAEMIPGVDEYNAIREGDWKAFAMSAGLDIGAVAIGVCTAGTGYAAVRGGSTFTKAGLKLATREVAEAGFKRVAKETAESGAKKVGVESIEAGSEKMTKEVVEKGAKKIAKEVTETETGKKLNETAIKEVDEVPKIVKNKMDGIAREERVGKNLISKYGKDNVIREAYIRDAKGRPIKDPMGEGARRLDFVVYKNNEVSKVFEVTSKTANKEAQVAKEKRILDLAAKCGDAFIKDLNTGKLIKLPSDIKSEIVRLN